MAMNSSDGQWGRIHKNNIKPHKELKMKPINLVKMQINPEKASRTIYILASSKKTSK
jgi:hypothetical protein